MEVGTVKDSLSENSRPDYHQNVTKRMREAEVVSWMKVIRKNN